jgi:hypothetical protein
LAKSTPRTAAKMTTKNDGKMQTQVLKISVGKEAPVQIQFASQFAADLQPVEQ